MVILLRPEKRFEIGFDPVLEIGLHGNGVEGGRVGEGNRSPPSKLVVGVDEEAQIAVPLLFDFVGDGVNVVKIRAKDSALVHLSDLENEGAVRFGCL